MELEKMKTSQQIMDEFGLTTGMITHYAKMFGVQKFGSSYLWTPEQVELVRQRIGKIGNKSKTPRTVYRDCKECSNLAIQGKKRYCTVVSREIGRNVTKSPRFCPLGNILPYTKSTQKGEN